MARKKRKTPSRAVSVPAKGMSPLGSPERAFLSALFAGKSVDEASRESGIGLGAARALLRRPDVRQAVVSEAEARDHVARRTPAQIERRIGDIGFSDIGALFDSEGRLKRLHDIAPEDRAAISALDVSEFHDRNGRVTRRVSKIRMEKRQPALDSLARMHAMLDDHAGEMTSLVINILPLDDSQPAETTIDMGEVDIADAEE